MDLLPKCLIVSCLALLVLFTTTVNGQSVDDDLQALNDFFVACNGDSEWAKTGVWSQGDHCKWDGITCSNDRVTEINLASRGLSCDVGKMLDILSKMDVLEVLDLSDNKLSGQISGALSNLLSLKTLKLQNNQLEGFSGPAFQKLLFLTELFLGYNKLSGDLSITEIGSMTALRVLNMTHNQLSGLPSTLSQLTSLEVVDFSWNHGLTGAAQLFSHTSLKIINLDGCMLKSLPSEMNLPQIEEIYIIENGIDGWPMGLSKLSNLKKLSAGGNTFASKIEPEHWKLFPSMIMFNFSDTGTPNGPDVPKGHPVQEIYCDENPNLSTIYVYDAMNLTKFHFTAYNWGPHNLDTVPSIKELLLDQLHDYPTAWPPHLETLTIRNSRYIPPEGWFIYLEYYQPSFKHFYLEEVNSWWLQPFSFPSWLYSKNSTGSTNYPNLLTISLIGDVVGELPSSFPWETLETFVVSNSSISGTISSKISALKNLKVLKITDNKYINGSIPTELVNLKNLESLIISGNAFESYILPQSFEAFNDLTVCHFNNTPSHSNSHQEDGQEDQGQQEPKEPQQQFQCEQEGFNRRICNIECGPSLSGTYMWENATCKPSILGSTYTQERLEIRNDNTFTWVSRDGKDCGEPYVYYQIEGTVKIVEAVKTTSPSSRKSLRSSTHRSLSKKTTGEEEEWEVQSLFEVSKVLLKCTTQDSLLFFQDLCLNKSKSQLKLNRWSDILTYQECLGTHFGMTGWWPGITNCPAYHQAFKFVPSRGALTFATGYLWSPGKCQYYDMTYSTESMKRNWQCSSDNLTACTPVCGDGLVVGDEQCDLGSGNLGGPDSGCTYCKLEQGCKTSYDEQGIPTVTCTKDSSSSNRGVESSRSMMVLYLSLMMLSMMMMSFHF